MGCGYERAKVKYHFDKVMAAAHTLEAQLRELKKVLDERNQRHVQQWQDTVPSDMAPFDDDALDEVPHEKHKS